jgi:hypothetical protein
MPFDRHTKSGQIAACSHEKKVPVRPQPPRCGRSIFQRVRRYVSFCDRCAPFIAIAPAWARIKPNHDDDPRGLVVALNSARLRDTARKALGTAACEIPYWFKAWDPFLREAADTLTALHAGRSPEPMCLAAFADVFALHLARRYGHSTGTRDAGTRLTQSKLSVVNHFILLGKSAAYGPSRF